MDDKKLPIGKIGIGIVSFIALLFLIIGVNDLAETNHAGNYQVKQAAITGEMTVRNAPGMYGQWFGTIHPYQLSSTFFFSKDDLDGGAGKEAAPIKVRFKDGSTGYVSGAIKYKLSVKTKDQLRLHEDFRGYASVKLGLIRQVVAESLIQTAALYNAEDTYAKRRATFTSDVEDQIINGIFDTITKDKIVYLDKELPSGKITKIKTTESETKPKLDKDGNIKRKKISPFSLYSITIVQFVVKDIDYDETIENLITKKKEAEQAKVVARANAEKAKQDTITTKEQGKAKVAKAEADALVVKMKDVTDAQKRSEVAIIKAEQKYQESLRNKKSAEQNALAVRVKGEADAYAAKLKVAAGLTPRERAMIDRDTAIGVAAQMAKVKFPGLMVIGGGGKGQAAIDPFQAVGLESFINISRKMAKSQ